MSANTKIAPMTRAQRARIARRLRSQGLTQREIAAAMGISRSYASSLCDPEAPAKDAARRESYRRPCPGYGRECGKLMTGSEGRDSPHAPRLCSECARLSYLDSRVWTREAVIEAIRLFAERKGRPPLATEWLMHGDQRGYEYPPASAVYRYDGGSRGGKRKSAGRYHPFETWADAIEAAGFPRPMQGHKVNKRGRGVSHTRRKYVILAPAGEGLWREIAGEAWNPETAVESTAKEPGEYVAVLERYFVRVTLAPQTMLKAVRSERNVAGGGEGV